MLHVRLLVIFGLLFAFAACTSSPEPAPPPTPSVRQAPPEPEPEPVREIEPTPVLELPKTASSAPAFGLAGVFALAGAGVVRVLRSRIG